MKIIDRILENHNKWKKRYNKISLEYETLASARIKSLEYENEILLMNIKYRDEIEKLKAQLKKYKAKYGNIESEDKNDKDKTKR